VPPLQRPWPVVAEVVDWQAKAMPGASASATSQAVLSWGPSGLEASLVEAVRPAPERSDHRPQEASQEAFQAWAHHHSEETAEEQTDLLAACPVEAWECWMSSLAAEGVHRGLVSSKLVSTGQMPLSLVRECGVADKAANLVGCESPHRQLLGSDG
jgi:hypothetical protein